MNAIYLELYPYCVVFGGVWDWQAARTEDWGVGQCLEETWTALTPIYKILKQEQLLSRAKGKSYMPAILHKASTTPMN